MELSLGKNISSIYRHQAIAINALIKDLNLSSGQYLFLLKINDQPGMTQKEICGLLNIDRANTTRALKVLEALGYIQLEHDEQDKRIRRSYPTDQGKLICLELKKRLTEITRILGEGLSSEEVLLVSKLLDKMDRNMQHHIEQLRGDHE